MFGYIYRTSFANGRYKYIGQKTSQTFLGEKYIGSGGKYFKDVCKKHSSSATVELLEEVFGGQDELNEREKYWISYYNAISDHSYLNIAPGGNGGNIIGNLPEEDYKVFIEKQRKLSTGKTKSSDTKLKIKNSNIGKKRSSETRRRISDLAKKRTGKAAAMYGKRHTDDTRDLISKKKIGSKMSDETKAKMSKIHKGENHHFYNVRGKDSPMYGKKRITNGSNTKFIKESELGKYLKDGYVLWRDRETLK